MSYYEAYCIDCGTSLFSKKSTRCRSCDNKKRWQDKSYKDRVSKRISLTHPNVSGFRNPMFGILRLGKYNPNWTGGMPKCSKCGKELKSRLAKVCWECYKKSCVKKPRPKGICPNCGESMSFYYAKMCKKCSRTGILNGRFIDGRSYLPYPISFNRKLKSQIKTRDDYKCCVCGISEQDNRIIYNLFLAIHHIDYDKNNNSSSNLVTLCPKCHSKTNTDREYWKEHFKLYESCQT